MTNGSADNVLGILDPKSDLPLAADNVPPREDPPQRTSPVKRTGVELNGVTAGRYGAVVDPTWVVIDREGRIAFDSDSYREPWKAMEAAIKARGLTPETSDFDAFLDAHLARQIERALGQK